MEFHKNLHLTFIFLFSTMFLVAMDSPVPMASGNARRSQFLSTLVPLDRQLLRNAIGDTYKTPAVQKPSAQKLSGHELEMPAVQTVVPDQDPFVCPLSYKDPITSLGSSAGGETLSDIAYITPSVDDSAQAFALAQYAKFKKSQSRLRRQLRHRRK